MGPTTCCKKLPGNAASWYYVADAEDVVFNNNNADQHNQNKTKDKQWQASSSSSLPPTSITPGLDLERLIIDHREHWSTLKGREGSDHDGGCDDGGRSRARW